MKNELKIEIYNFESQSVRVSGTFEEPRFAVKDVCNILGLSNVTAAVRNIPDKWKGVQKFLTPQGEHDLLVISEAWSLPFICNYEKISRYLILIMI